MNKPPLGLKPRWKADEERAEEIAIAISRYQDARKAIPNEWLDEYDELLLKISKRKAAKRETK